MKVKEIEAILKATPVEQLVEQLKQYEQDERTGVQKLVSQYQKKYDQHQAVISEWEMRMAFDEVFDEHEVVVGVDEVGRGPLAGPVVAAAVILPANAHLLGLKDSKQLSDAKKEVLYNEIKKQALAIGIGIVDAERIDEINILQATFEAMRQALGQIQKEYQCILVDGNKEIPSVECKQEAIIGGDNKSASIAAASVIAKVTRDHMMEEYAKLYPGYDWESNKGYGSQKHYDGIRQQGVTPLHRKSFLKNEGIQ
ncbi:MAG: ribonuclease HII [Cellulosilyticum sp.]|nr:ribonuclease HII [Cellulosilyticum sp.]